MNTIAKSLWTAVVLGSCVVAAGEALAAGRPADAILKDLEAVEMPKLDASKRNDQAYVREYLAKRQETLDKRAALALELYKTAPNHARVPELMVARWRMSIRPTGLSIEDFLKEIDQVLTQATDSKFKLEAIFTKAQLK